MKTIVAPTDFSASSVNAVNYAAELALKTGCSLSIFHVCMVPVAIGEAMPVFSLDELYAEAEKEMERLRNEVYGKTEGQLIIHTAVRHGGVMEEIYNYCHSVNPWMVVMGAEKGGALERFLLGGHTNDAIKKLQWPLVIVPQDAKFHTIYRIGLACDLQDVERTMPLRLLEELVNQFKAELYVLHVSRTPGARFSEEKIEQTESLRDMLKHLNPKYKFIDDTNVELAIDEFATYHQVDMLIVLPKDHGFFHKLLHGSEAKKIALTSHIPLVSIHE